MDKLLQTFRPNHPKVVAENGRIELYRSELSSRSGELLEEIKRNHATLAELDPQVASELADAKREHDAQENRLMQLKASHSKLRAEWAGQRDPVTVHQAAEISEYPTMPRIIFPLTIGGLLSIALIGTGSMYLAHRLIRPQPSA